MPRRSLIAEGPIAALRFLVPAWRQAWWAMAPSIVLFGAIWALGDLAATSPWRPWSVLVLVGTLLAVQGTLYRLALCNGVAFPGVSPLGLAQARIGAVWALTLLFMFVLALLAFVVILAFAFAVAAAGHGFVTARPSTWAGAVDGRGRAVVTAVAVICLAGLTWAATRVSLAAAASVARGRVQVLASWPATRGLVWAIILGRLALGLPTLGVSIAILWSASAMTGVSPLWVWVAGLAAGGVIAGLWLPSSVGFMAYIYQQGTSHRLEHGPP
jgi:hypothetical protein